jgi:predicted nucleic acid-binding protein
MLDSHLVKNSCNYEVYEVFNAFRYAEGLDAEDVVRAVEALRNIGLRVVDTMELLSDAVRKAFENNITVYGAIYIALAERIGGALIIR